MKAIRRLQAIQRASSSVLGEAEALNHRFGIVGDMERQAR